MYPRCLQLIMECTSTLPWTRCTIHPKCRLRPDPALHVFPQDGYAFRVHVAYHREPQVLRESVGPDGLLVVRDNEAAQALELATVHRPLLTSTLHG